MSTPTNRRSFLQSSIAGSTVLGMGDLSFLSRLPAVSAAEARLDPKVVQFQPEIEPLVRLLEDTPLEQLLEAVAAKIMNGTSYREVLAALLLAGVRNVQPRPSVGFKFHAVLVVNSAHLASLASGTQDRWLPIFWAIDYFKNSQADEARQSGWRMAPVDESRVPPAHRARQAFIDAIESWDAEAVDAAVAGLVRTAGANEVIELFYKYGARDYRSIGHKAIFVANSWRTLQSIGWRYAEPVCRSLAYALVNHHGEPNPADSDLAADRPWRTNQDRLAKIPAEWQAGKVDDGAARDLLSTLHDGTSDDACDQTIELLARGVSPQSIWDALLVGGGELLMRQPGIIGLHGLTTANALRFAYDHTASETTRQLAMLQYAAFLPLFRGSAQGRGELKPLRMSDLDAQVTEGQPAEVIGRIMADISRDPLEAAARVRGYIVSGGDPELLIGAARQLIFVKGSNAHDYKFSAAVLEDCYKVSPAWRDAYLATSVFNLRGTGDRDNGLVERTRAAFE